MASGEIGRASIFLASGTVVSRLLGFVRSIVLAAAIGLVGSASADAFAVANQLPNTVYTIVAGACSRPCSCPRSCARACRPTAARPTSTSC
ncbi:hypothetical protein [Agromyces mangrovi Wang et al. 2018]|uniref:hypothetical protein n=1 Tax=Agromyces mangrovi TaxID=1858653 RepID=UPI0025725248|nr:hypothetical protein [Agromyces mangrovi]